MSGRLSESFKLRIKKYPKGFFKALEQELADKKINGMDFEQSTPKKEGDLRAANRIRVSKGEVRISNRQNYASYVDDSGPRVGGPGMKRWFSKRANSKFVQTTAKRLRDRMVKAQKKKSGK